MSSLNAIRGVCIGRKRTFVTDMNEAGILGGVLFDSMHGRKAVWSLIPIGDESLVRFANFLCDRADEEERKSGYSEAIYRARFEGPRPRSRGNITKDGE
jgi:hypothetical protein